jgi:protein tyrosine/serine phosphatase
MATGSITKRRIAYAAGVMVFAVLLAAGYVLFVRGQGNFHAITPGEAYRSGQPDGEALARYVKQYKIKSVLNLRGACPGLDWYEEEAAASARLGLKRYDIDLAAKVELTDEEVRRLMEIFRTAPRPILIHCKHGADRTGLVAAMWKAAVDGETKEEAGKQLALKFGHLPIGGTRAMDRSFERWKPEAVR